MSGQFITSASAGEYTIANAIDSKYTAPYSVTVPHSFTASNIYPVYIRSGSSTIQITKPQTSSSSISLYCSLLYPLL